MLKRNEIQPCGQDWNIIQRKFRFLASVWNILSDKDILSFYNPYPWSTHIILFLGRKIEQRAEFQCENLLFSGKGFLLRNLGPASPYLSQNSEVLLVCLHCHQSTPGNVACATSRALYPRVALDSLAINTVEEVPDQLALTGSILTHLRTSSM